MLLVRPGLSAVVGAEQQCWARGAGCCTREAGEVLRLGSWVLGPCVGAGDSQPGSALLPPKMAALPRPQCVWPHAGTRLEAVWGWAPSAGHVSDGAVRGGSLGTVRVPPGRQQNRVRLPAHPAIAAVTKHRPLTGVAGDVLVSCLAPALGGWGSPSPARGLPAAAITQHRWPWGGLRAGGIWCWRGAAPCGEGTRGASVPLTARLHLPQPCPPLPAARRPPGRGWEGGSGRQGVPGVLWALPHIPVPWGLGAQWPPLVSAVCSPAHAVLALVMAVVPWRHGDVVP